MRRKTVLAVLAVICSPLIAQPKDDAVTRLEAVAKKYQDIGSYEAEATAARSLGPGIEVRIQLRLGYASPKFTPPDSPVAVLRAIRMGRFETTDNDIAKVVQQLLPRSN